MLHFLWVAKETVHSFKCSFSTWISVTYFELQILPCNNVKVTSNVKITFEQNCIGEITNLFLKNQVDLKKSLLSRA